MPTKQPCSICQFSVHNNHRAIFCNCCHHWTHLKYNHFSLSEYNYLTNSDEAWFCPPCLANIFPFNHMEDVLDYYFSLYDFQTTSFDVEVLKTKCFNPFLVDSDSRHLLINSDIDPDSNILGYNSHLLSNCLYLTSNEFNNITLSTSDSFTLFHINLRSLKKHYEELSEFLSTPNMPFSVIGISETWLNNSNDDIFNIPGYKFISNNRQHKHGDGVGLFINDDLNFKLRSDLQSSDKKLCESIFIELIQPNAKNILIGCFYKPPDTSVSDFNSSISNVLCTLSFENKISYLMGDFNINLLNCDMHQATNDFVNLLTSNSFLTLISEPTRITSSTATLIDNMASRILYSDLSDHFPIFQITQMKLISDSTPKKKCIRQINSYSTSQFLSKLKNIDRTFLYDLNSVNDCYDRFANCIIPIYNQSFPLKPVITETRLYIKPWFADGLYVSYKRKKLTLQTICS